MSEIANSAYLDFTSYRTTSATDPLAAYGINPQDIKYTNSTINVGLVLNRANDPTELLNGDWATRQKALETLRENGTLWSTYGADTTNYNTVLNALTSMGIQVIGDPTGSDGYVTSQASRTIWLALDSSTFEQLFGTQLLRVGPSHDPDYLFWNGNLSLPDAWNVEGIWPDLWASRAISNLAGDASVTLPQGPQGVGNNSTVGLAYFAQEIGRYFYNFPTAWADQPTGAIGLIEPGVGDALPPDAEQSFKVLLDKFREEAGLSTLGSHYTQGASRQEYTGSAGERALDVGVVTSAAPGSEIGLYVGSGFGGASQSTTYTAYQAAFWDLLHNPGIISSSFIDEVRPAPNSPFWIAAYELFVDAALRNISVFSANGDGGSGDLTGNGITNQYSTYISTYGMLVGGTALSSAVQAAADSTLQEIIAAVAAGNSSVIWQLVSGGMTKLPVEGSANSTLIETVWNSYFLNGTNLEQGYGENNASSGGADPSHPIPWYQLAYGLNPLTADPYHEPGRGTPDVSALAGGGMDYKAPGENMKGIYDDYGTSAATPFWASLTAHLNADFAEIGLPRLGYANDLFYIAAVVAPASFNDITVGSNMSTFSMGGPISTSFYGGGTQTITPTGFGDQAGPGYDLVSGLGSPNATLLAQALAAIATAQYYHDTPNVLDLTETGNWQSSVDQSLLFQAVLSSNASVDVEFGGNPLNFPGQISDTFAWTTQFAQQTLQSDFSPTLVTMFDGQGQGPLLQSAVQAGDELNVWIGGSQAGTPQGTLSSPYGFVDFVSGETNSAIQVARPVAIAQTAEAADDQVAVLRMRQNGVDDTSLLLYRVDDLSGSINGLQPGDAGYEQAADGRAYHLASGRTFIGGPGYGEYGETTVLGVNAGDIIAMKLTNTTEGGAYWSFDQANETVNGQHVAHIWSYGLNTWGFDDTRGGGDQDFNDLVIQLDFTSASGSDWLV
ncbi:DUF4114 domain-containing protein [Aquabacter sp. CN5-332]|uniref:DUF4114 domain-containing protein n=1 Tax=Aquabacter sp. CN5-332 TaxID=3156608 RepID=UPI0032B34DD3